MSDMNPMDRVPSTESPARKDFEDFVLSTLPTADLRLAHTGRYLMDHVQDAWECWKMEDFVDCERCLGGGYE